MSHVPLETDFPRLHHIYGLRGIGNILFENLMFILTTLYSTYSYLTFVILVLICVVITAGAITTVLL